MRLVKTVENSHSFFIVSYMYLIQIFVNRQVRDSQVCGQTLDQTEKSGPLFYSQTRICWRGESIKASFHNDAGIWVQEYWCANQGMDFLIDGQITSFCPDHTEGGIVFSYFVTIALFISFELPGLNRSGHGQIGQ